MTDDSEREFQSRVRYVIEVFPPEPIGAPVLLAAAARFVLRERHQGMDEVTVSVAGRRGPRCAVSLHPWDPKSSAGSLLQRLVDDWCEAQENELDLRHEQD